MKALILVGGFGTRLRPLTFSCPKSIVEFANKPIVTHQIKALVDVGVKEIILAVGFQPKSMIEKIQQFEKEFGVKIICSQETEPLGTAGPIRLAKEILEKDNQSELFLFLIVILFANSLSKKCLNSIKNMGKKLEPKSLERDIFPKMSSDGQLYSQDLEGFWMDVGQPEDFIIGTQLILDSYKKNTPEKLSTGQNIIGNVLIESSSKISANCLIGPNVTIGSNCVIEDGVRLQNVIVLSNCTIKAYTWVKDSIIGWDCSVGKWVRIEGLSVLGEDVHIKDELFINQAKILPHKAITSNISEKGQILM
ncbi:mannose-1-phosphate guanyltransferase mpg1, putative [Ichthyophthirius multifiliis]|uniref:Mannose-1-phosphate guanyltransferase mpg1, putative n=1 Tax=Ichthyophthirius multifiliis TaxID=5932 RepID=G0R3P0_ICHMU|nr:mannose-1-phosphate guanyltransferase mpg1, putative [Ichthyophthirius multifiliis]EGR27923.1 mannose-1-phosphate guanyltransferase mpg1, putative [Ichthyophthirius multifiliis]|eukprot:XP_004027268.1 mannose-1-phosphate guanyltransferase mpg1, putative [Ichthyophthirius multifiliis]